MRPAAAATWTDAATGVAEHVGFFERRESRCFAVAHLPTGRVHGAAVVCSPILIEQMRNYRREVELGRALAARGVATLRFHYRGTGHSDGASAELTLESMVEDTRAAAAHLLETVGEVPLVAVGTRVGALVAVVAVPTAPLALWQPVVRARAYVREIQRARAVGELRHAEEDVHIGVAEADGEVLGFRLTEGLVASLGEVDLADLLRSRRAPVLVVEAVRRRDDAPAPRELARLADLGSHVSVVGVQEDASSWWFPAALSQARATDADLLETTVNWIAGVVVAS